jgi:hypothetical protein
MIVADGKGGSLMKKFAIADDFEESDGRTVLDFWQAQKQARLITPPGNTGSCTTLLQERTFPNDLIRRSLVGMDHRVFSYGSELH